MQTRNKKLNNHEKIVAIMANNRDREWWFVKDIINAGEGTDNWYVGYEASARMAELAKKFPDMFETRDDGKYKKRRVRWEAMSEWFEELPTSYRHIIHKTGATHGVIRKDPHAIGDAGEKKMPAPHEYRIYQADYKGRDKKIKQGIQEIKMSKLVMGQPIVVLTDESKYRTIYMRLDQFRKDWVVK